MKGTKVLKLSILSLSFLMMLRLTIAPALSVIGEAVGKNATDMQTMVIVASIFAIPFVFISGLLANKMKKKTLLYIGLVLYIAGGLGPMLNANFTFMLVCRALLGIGTGLFTPLTAGLIADFFKGEEFNKMIGFQSAAVSVGNIITSALAGILANINWRLAFLIYAFAIISFFLVAFKIPEPERIEKAPEEGKSVNNKMMFISIAIFIYAIIYFAFFGFISYVVAQLGGNAAQAGIAQTIMTFLSLVVAIFFAPITKALKKASVPIILLINLVGFFVISQASSIGVVMLGSAFIGMGFGLLMPYGTARVMDAAPASSKTFANGLYMTFVNVGTAVSPFLLAAILGVFGKEANDGQFIWLTCAILLAVGTIISIILAITSKKTQTQ